MKKITLSLFTLLSFVFVQAQNDCNSAISVTSGATTTVGTIDGTAVTTACAPDTSGGGPATAAEWYSFTATVDGYAVATADLPQNAGGDTRLHIYSGSCGSLVCEAGNDDVSGQNFLSEATFLVTTGTTYYIVFDDYWDGAGFDFMVTETAVTCNQQVAPYTNDADDEGDFLVCHTAIDNDANGTGWIRQDLDLDSDGTTEDFFTNGSNNSVQKDDYLFSPVISLEAGKTYNITAKYNGADASATMPANESLDIIMSTGNTVADANAGTVIHTQTGITQNGAFADVENNATSISASFTAPADGNYHITFKSYAVNPAGFLLLFEYGIDEDLSTTENTFNNFDYYTSNGVLYLSSNNSIETATIYDITGKQAQSVQINSNNGIVNIGNLQSGVYIAQANIEGQTKSFKFVKK